MTSISVGPFAVTTSTAIVILFIAVFQGALWYICRGTPHAKAASDRFFVAVFAGLLMARVAFVVAMWSIYSQDWLSIIDIRDGGFNPTFGCFVAVLLILARSHRTPDMLRAYLKSAMIAVTIALPALIVSQISESRLSFYDLTLENQQADVVDTRIFAGKPVVLNLWASWCPPCRREMPVLQNAQKTRQDISFVFVNQGENPQTANDYLEQQQLILQHMYFDPFGEVASTTGSFGLPTTLFFYSDGKFAASHVGELSEASLQYYIDRLH